MDTATTAPASAAASEKTKVDIRDLSFYLRRDQGAEEHHPAAATTAR